MSANVFNTEIPQGEYWALGLLVQDETPAPVDFTGWEGEIVVRSNVASPTALLRTPVSIPTGDAEKNVVVELTAAQTLSLSPNKREETVVYEVLVWETADKDNTADRIVEGTFSLLPSVSREDAA